MRSLIGSRVARLEDPPLLRGQGRYVDDIPVSEVLHAAFVRSPHAHALITGVSTAVAAALPGVHAVLTLDDLAPAMAQRRMARVSYSGTALGKAWPYALAEREVSYVGEAVAMVLAESRYVAEDAVALVEVTYEVLPCIADCRGANTPGAPPVRRELSSNVLTAYKVGYGDVEPAFRRAAHIFRIELSQNRGGAHPIEGRGILAEYRKADDTFIVWASTQKANDLQNTLVSLLGIDENSIRVAAPDIGGGFGPKLCIYSEDVAVVAAAKLLRRSIKWIEDRREHFTNAVQERDQHWSLEIALDAEAKIQGLRGSLLHDQGAYALQDVNLAYNSATSVTGPYVVPAFAMDVTLVLTNKVPVSSVRGAGYPQAAFAIERLLDLAARELKMDRAELRRLNLIAPEKMPYTKPLKARSGATIQYDSGDYPATQAKAVEAIGWDDFPRRQAQGRRQGRYLGIGLAHALKGTGRGPFEAGIVRISPSGRVSVFTGASAMGQGLRTALAQICASQLGMEAQDIHVVAGDTAVSALGLGGFASRQTVTAGSSVMLAAKAVAEKAKKLASHVLEAAEEDLELAGGEIRVVGAPQLKVPLAELSRILQGAPGYAFPAGMEPGLEANANFRTDALAYANACHAAEVEVDVETGAVKILRYVAMQDSGTLINPMLVDGQVVGGVVHGVGNALYDGMEYDEAAQPLTTTFADYLLPTAREAPPIQTLYQQTPSPLNPLGVKGVGELGTIPAAAAIISAVEDALQPIGVRLTEVPLSPRRLIAAIREARSSTAHG